jgi:hypothetical protein
LRRHSLPLPCEQSVLRWGTPPLSDAVQGLIRQTCSNSFMPVLLSQITQKVPENDQEHDAGMKVKKCVVRFSIYYNFLIFYYLNMSKTQRNERWPVFVIWQTFRVYFKLYNTFFIRTRLTVISINKIFFIKLSEKTSYLFL